MNLLVTFIVLNALNVVIQTVKSICTINSGKTVAAIVNAVAYGLYTVVVVYMVCELPLWEKALIIGLCNLAGVYVVKLLEEKGRKDRLWKIELTTNIDNYQTIHNELKTLQIPHNYIQTNDKQYYIFNIYCATQKESHLVRELVERHGVKYFVSETKNL